MKIRVLTGKLQSFVPDKGMNAEGWSEVKLDKNSLPFVVVKSICNLLITVNCTLSETYKYLLRILASYDRT